MTNIIAILQARISSSRLPGKVLMPLLGKPMLERQLERNHRSRNIDSLIVATSTDPSDDPIAEFCREANVAVYRGSLDDVLDRYYQAASGAKADVVVRLTADCPLADPGVLDQLVRFHLDGGYDYSSNTIERTFPKGVDAEIFGFDVLQTAWNEARLPSHREHVTPFMIENPERFRLGSFKQTENLSDHRWTVDYPADFAFVEAVYESLYLQNSDFSSQEIFVLLKNKPDLAAINAHFDPEETASKSRVQDAAFLAGRAGEF